MNSKSRRGSFRAKVGHNALQQRSRAGNYGHLRLPRGIPMFEEEVGTTVSIDILPYEVTDPRHLDRDDELEIAIPGSLWYRRPYKLHRNVGVAKLSLVCPTTFGKPCPICEERDLQLSRGAEYKDPSIQAMKASNRNLYYVVPQDSRKFEKVPHLWDISQYCFQDALNEELNTNDKFHVFPELGADGLTLRVRFGEGKIEKTSFAVTSRIDFDVRNYQYDDSVLDDLPSLDTLLDVKDPKEVERLFFETPGEPDEEEEPRPTAPVVPARSATRSITKPADTPRREDQDRRAPADRPARTAAERGAAATRTVVEERRTALGRGEATRVVADKESRDDGDPPFDANGEASEDDNRCPSGHRFGVDVDKPEFRNDCNECPAWHDCMDAREAA